MTEWRLSHDPAARPGSFAAVVVLMSLWEVLAETLQASEDLDVGTRRRSGRADPG